MGFGGVGSFTQLSDAPRSYVGQALKVIGVRSGENGLEFAAGLPPLNLGAGFNFLRVSQMGGNLFVQWVDVQGLIIALTGALNRLITPPELLIPAPSASQVSVAASSPSGLMGAPALGAPVPVISATAVLV
ncbi:MAG: hypothetical protein Q7K03_07320 [Dehalococcoidia bacterium]|nr:hypothetical protein [Dehalococcoidia bacterium]